jgi:hypothetical protein
MFRFKALFVGVFAAFALGAAASGPALADTCTGGNHFVFCTFPGNEPIHSLAFVGTGGLWLFSSKVGATEVKLHCPDSTLSGTLQLLGLALGEISFLGCLAEKPANCTIPSLILAIFHLQATATSKGLLTGHKTGATQEFTNVTLSGSSCAIANNYTITGTQEVEFPFGVEGLVNHEIVARKSGSKLKFGAENASMSFSSSIHLDSDELWLIMAGE